MKKALITGITGQDGSYLTELLLEKGYEVHGIVRASSSFNRGRIDHIYLNPKFRDTKLFLHYGDLVDTSSLHRILDKISPDEIYNLAAQSHVKVSFDVPDYTAQVDALGTLRFLDAIREVGMERQTRFYQASTSELYGKVSEIPQNENTPFYPRSPYGVAKLYGFWIVKNYREAYNLFAVNGILFNHESPRRGETFVTRKISIAVVKIALGLQDKIILGNLNAKRDWGYAPEFCEGMWRMLKHDVPEDFVLATGETHSVREFCELAFREIGVELEWIGKEENEKGIVKMVNKEQLSVIRKKIIEGKMKRNNGLTNYADEKSLKTDTVLIEVSPSYYRPTEVDLLIGDSSKAKRLLGWNAKVNLEGLVKIMVEADFDNFVNG